MAVTNNELIARRSALLLRCQKVRERRLQLDTLRAEHGSTTAAAAEQSAQAAVSCGRLADAERLRQARDTLSGRMVQPGELATLPALEQELACEARELDQTLAAAVEAARVARGTADAAREALLAERRATEKKSKLTERAQKLWRRTVNALEELDRDEQVADTWRSV